MFDKEKLTQALLRRGYAVRYFKTAAEAADYLNAAIDNTTVAFGGSVTLQQMGLYPRLAEHNKAVWHWQGDALADAAHTQVYISSVNALAQTGEIINIDGNCNRITSIQFGHPTVYLVLGANKIAPDYDAALWRARNVAAPKNAQRLGKNTPCAAKGDRCYDCSSPERICRGLSVLWAKPNSIQSMELIVVEEALGY